jgi:transposase-like protein
MNAYSQDLKEKIIRAMSELGMGKSEASRTFGVILS